MRFRFHHEGRPIPYKRPAFRSKRNPKGAGTPLSKKQLQDLTLLVNKALREADRGTEIKWNKDLPVKVTVEFGFAPAKGEGGAGRLCGYTDVVVEQVLVFPFEESYWAKEPDLDNCVKMIFEALQHGGAVKNDSQVVVMNVCKKEDWRQWKDLVES